MADLLYNYKDHCAVQCQKPQKVLAQERQKQRVNDVTKKWDGSSGKINYIATPRRYVLTPMDVIYNL